MRIVKQSVLRNVACLCCLAVLVGAWTSTKPKTSARRFTARDRAEAMAVARQLHLPDHTEYLGIAYSWWNDGSCHGYPDVMEVYVIEGDGNGNPVASDDIGDTEGTDSCSTYHGPPWFSDSPLYYSCGCNGNEFTPVFGDRNGTTTEAPF
jgi:hypothetical protein